MNEIDHHREKAERSGLMRQRNGNWHTEEHRQNAQENLKCDKRQKPIQSAFNFSSITLVSCRKIENHHGNEYCESKPAMDEDNGLWGFKNIDK